MKLETPSKFHNSKNPQLRNTEQNRDMVYRSQFHIEGRVISSITMVLLAHDSPRINCACWSLAAAPFRDGADLARFCSCIFRKLELHTHASTVGMLITIIESCFQALLPKTARMLINASALIVAKIIHDERVCIVDVARLIKVDVARLQAAEHYVAAVLLQTCHASGRRIAPTEYARPLLSSYDSYSRACAVVVRELGATHIVGCWRRTLAVRVLLALRAERDTVRPAKSTLAAKLDAAAQLAATIVAQRAYRKAKLANDPASPVSIMSWPDRPAPVGLKAFALTSRDTFWSQRMRG